MELEQPSAGSSKCEDCVGRAVVWAVCHHLKKEKRKALSVQSASVLFRLKFFAVTTEEPQTDSTDRVLCEHYL